MAEPDRCICGEPLREGANYCVACGREVRQPCPACGQECRWLATLDTDSLPWCENRHVLLYACEQCGRWLLPGDRLCPDPDCGGRVVPSRPLYTGRDAAGGGVHVNWKWPTRWLATRAGPCGAISWSSPDTLYAAFVAHGRWYVWVGSVLLELDPTVFCSEQGGMPGDGVIWRAPLGSSVRPASGIPFADRAAVVGSVVMLATENGYVLTGLHGRREVACPVRGMPLAQVANPFWWIGWVREEGSKCLYLVSVEATSDRFSPVAIETPPEAAIARGGQVVLQDDTAFWPAEDGSVWRLDCLSGQVRRLFASSDSLPRIWVQGDRIGVTREVRGHLQAGLGMLTDDRMPLEVPAGNGPLREVFATSDYLVVVGERPVMIDPVTGERVHESTRVCGRWVGGVLASASGSEPCLLLLTHDGAMSSLRVLQLASGVEDLCWWEPNRELLGLLPIGDLPVIVHRGGLIRLVARLSG
ncbi:MAG: zinc ribbon domain-containing protein [Chloroherpetonaceae bacterium]|nr:zinc ribbon domain-containing protein [Chthonomonadaceae bacterium]MDW8206816.1 zinc ribbon domain-containing protein [Chloroherpetonaceae bacterium]